MYFKARGKRELVLVGMGGKQAATLLCLPVDAATFDDLEGASATTHAALVRQANQPPQYARRGVIVGRAGAWAGSQCMRANDDQPAMLKVPSPSISTSSCPISEIFRKHG